MMDLIEGVGEVGVVVVGIVVGVDVASGLRIVVVVVVGVDMLEEALELRKEEEEVGCPGF